jgi:hypothetical protein
VLVLRGRKCWRIHLRDDKRDDRPSELESLEEGIWSRALAHDLVLETQRLMRCGYHSSGRLSSISFDRVSYVNASSTLIGSS